VLHFKTKLKYAILFAISFAVLTSLSFAGGLLLNIEFAPPPVSQALFDLISFMPIIFIASLILGFLESFLLLWLAQHHHPKWLWIITLVLAIILGGLASFFSLVTVWVLTAIANLVLTYIMVHFLECRLPKAKPIR